MPPNRVTSVAVEVEATRNTQNRVTSASIAVESTKQWRVVTSVGIMVEYTRFAIGSKSAYFEGIIGTWITNNAKAFTQGIVNATSSKHSYLAGGDQASSSVSGFTFGKPISSVPAYMYADPVYYYTKSYNSVYITGEQPITVTRWVKVWLVVEQLGSSSKGAYLLGGYSNYRGSTQAFVKGESSKNSRKAVYLKGYLTASSSKSVYIDVQPGSRSSKHVYLNSTFPIGGYMANAYVTFSNSNGSLIKRFKVISEGYDDGLPDKTVSMQKTVGGSLDISQGAVYKSWSPTIRCRGTETDTNYGTISDLQTFYAYNNPNGDPSDKILMTDHHGIGYTCVILGEFRKALLGTMIEGTEAHWLVKLRLHQVTGE